MKPSCDVVIFKSVCTSMKNGIVSFRFSMGKKCCFCEKTSWASTGAIFKLTDEAKLAMGLSKSQWDSYTYCCEDHYSEQDVASGGERKRLRMGAVPVKFKAPISFTLEHTYSIHTKVGVLSNSIFYFIYQSRESRLSSRVNKQVVPTPASGPYPLFCFSYYSCSCSLSTYYGPISAPPAAFCSLLLLLLHLSHTHYSTSSSPSGRGVFSRRESPGGQSDQ